MVQFFDPAQEQEIKRRRRMADMLMQQGAPKQTEIVSGYAVPQSGLEQLARGLSGMVGSYQAATADTKEQELAKQRQELLAKAVEQWGSDPKAAAGTLMQDPSMMKEGLGIYGEAMKNDRAAMEAQSTRAYEDAKWQRDADLKRELQKMRSGSTEPYIDENTGEIVQPLPKLSSTEQKAFEEQQQTIQNLQNAKGAFGDIKSYLNKPMYSGAGAETISKANALPIIGGLVNDEKAANTLAYQNLVKSGQYAQLKTMFPGAISNSERTAIESLGALASYTPEQQAEIIKNAESGLNRLLSAAQGRASDIASGQQYRKAVKPQAAGAVQPTNDPLASARDAIARGAPRDAVIKRLQENGIDATGL